MVDPDDGGHARPNNQNAPSMGDEDMCMSNDGTDSTAAHVAANSYMPHKGMNTTPAPGVATSSVSQSATSFVPVPSGIQTTSPSQAASSGCRTMSGINASQNAPEFYQPLPIFPAQLAFQNTFGDHSSPVTNTAVSFQPPNMAFRSLSLQAQAPSAHEPYGYGLPSSHSFAFQPPAGVNILPYPAAPPLQPVLHNQPTQVPPGNLKRKAPATGSDHIRSQRARRQKRDDKTVAPRRLDHLNRLPTDPNGGLFLKDKLDVVYKFNRNGLDLIMLFDNFDDVNFVAPRNDKPKGSFIAPIAPDQQSAEALANTMFVIANDPDVRAERITAMFQTYKHGTTKAHKAEMRQSMSQVAAKAAKQPQYPPSGSNSLPQSAGGMKINPDVKIKEEADVDQYKAMVVYSPAQYGPASMAAWKEWQRDKAKKRKI